MTILSILRNVIQPEGSFTPMHIPVFDEREVELLRECVESNFVSSVGEFCNRFESGLAEFTGCRRVILCVNGTSALHLSLLLAGVRTGDEVLIPSFTFVATANAVRYCGAFPHFVEIEESSLGVCPEKLEAYLSEIGEVRRSDIGYRRSDIGDRSSGGGDRISDIGDRISDIEDRVSDVGERGVFVNRRTGRPIRVLVPMHAFGHPVDMDALKAVADKYGLAVVEDAAESLGSYYKGQHTGNRGLCAALSFNGNKIITTGGGGAILTNDEALADRAKHLSTTAKVPHKWEFVHDAVGYNYRMPALNAALGCAQLEKLPGFIEKKRQLAKRYEEAFAGVEGVRFLKEPSYGRSNYWLNTLILDDDSGKSLESLLEETNGNGIMTRPAWTPMHLLDIHADCPRMNLPVTESMARRVINIPSSAGIGERMANE